MENPKRILIDKLKYFLVAVGVIIADQISKAIVIKKIPLYFGKVDIIKDFISLIHVRNKAAGFSLGSGFTGITRILFIFIVPLLLMIGLSYVLYNSEKFKINTKIEKTALGLIIGGGIGNLIDRVFRSEGVVDFINVRVFGFFGFEYWPTFNIADSCVVIGVILIIIQTIIFAVKEKKKNKREKNANNI